MANANNIQVRHTTGKEKLLFSVCFIFFAKAYKRQSKNKRMEPVEVDLDNIFSLPMLETRDISRISKRLSNEIETLEKADPKSRVAHFCSFFEVLIPNIDLKVPDEDFPRVSVISSNKKGVYLYSWRGSRGTIHLVLDFNSNKAGFWDPKKTGKELGIWS